MITINDITEGANIQLENGVIFIIEYIETKLIYGVATVLVHSRQATMQFANYCDELNDAVDFFNEENAKVI